ncbi:MAG: tetratricopeptide repeat protein [Candidatus Obscuribacter sp.]|nr:tetratricopeptide repeat protein [Candidatus Obscuribacter sp.]
MFLTLALSGAGFDLSVLARRMEPGESTDLARLESLGKSSSVNISSYVSSLTQSSHSAEFYQRAAKLVIYLNRENSELAVKLANAAVLQHPDDAVSYRARGDVWLEVDENQLAQKDLERAIKLDDKNAETYYNYAQALRNQLKYQDALPNLDKAIAIAPLTFRYHDAQGQVLKLLRRDVQAEAAFKKALTLAPPHEHWLPRSHLANFYEQTKALDKAIEQYQLIKLEPHFKSSPGKQDVHIGRCLVELKQYKKALPYLNSAMTSGVTFELLQLRARTLDALGDKAGAAKDRAKIKAIEADF